MGSLYTVISGICSSHGTVGHYAKVYMCPYSLTMECKLWWVVYSAASIPCMQAVPRDSLQGSV